MGTKTNPGQFDCYAKLDPDEPYFVLRAKDVLAPGLVRRWSALAANIDGDREKVAEAGRVAHDMERWREAKGKG